MKNEHLLDLTMDLGYELAISGAETFRVEESISRCLAAYGLQAEVFAIPNMLMVAIRSEDGQTLTRMRRIGAHGSDLDAVERFSNLSRTICAKVPVPEEALQMLKAVQSQRRTFPVPIQYLGSFLGAAGFSLFFGANWADSLCGGLCGLLVHCVKRFLEARKANAFFQTIAVSFCMTLLGYILGILGLSPNPDSAIIGALMLLVPGLLFTNAMRDIIYGDTNSGVNRVVQVCLVAAALGLGTGTAWWVTAMFWGLPLGSPDIHYSILAQCIFSFVACYGFSLLFNVHGPGGILCALGGALSWGVYLIVLEMGYGDIIAYFFSGLFSSVYSETMARIRKYPAISYLVCSIFPMIPGAGVYYTMEFAMQHNTGAFASKGMHTAGIAGILAVGILLGSTVFRMYSDWRIRKHT